MWIKIKKAPLRADMVFRIHIADQDAPGDPVEDWIYENDVVLRSEAGWVLVKAPIVARIQTGSDNPDTTGFIIAPPYWGMPTNNKKLDLDKVVAWRIAFVSTGFDLDSMEVMLDGFQRTGNRPIPFVIFNGIAAPNYMSEFDWGGAKYDVVTGAGPIPNSNAIKWTFGDDWKIGLNGFGYNVNPPFNLSGGWPVDSLKFMMKTDKPGVQLLAQFESGAGKVAVNFKAKGDTLWHEYIFPLRDFKSVAPGFDSSAVSVFQFMTNDTTGILGHVAYITNVWTGTPALNFVPPAAPQSVTVYPDKNYSNIITWQDVPGQSGETYNVYYSLKPITDINSPDVDVVSLNTPHG
ncbi:MAG: hypothetical protein ACPL1K_07705, partial [Candidatus Kryptoniota bacterium]